MRASSPAAAAEDDDDDEASVDNKELPPVVATTHGDTVTLAGDEDTTLDEPDADDLLALIGSKSLKDRFNERTGLTRIHLGVASEAARRIKHAVDVKKQVKVRMRRDLSMDEDTLYSDISCVDIEYYISDV